MYVSHCTCGALSIALVVRCTPDARDKMGDRDIPAPPPTAVLGSSAAASSSHQPIPRARRFFPSSWNPLPMTGTETGTAIPAIGEDRKAEPDARPLQTLRLRS